MLRLADAGVGDQGHAVGALEHQPPRGGVDGLARDGEELDAEGDVAVLGAEGEREQVEEEGAIVLRLERHEAPARVGAGEPVERDEVRRLAAERGPVIDELDRHLPRGEVELHAIIVPDPRGKGKAASVPCGRLC